MAWSPEFVDALRRGALLSFRLKMMSGLTTVTKDGAWGPDSIVSVSIDGAEVSPVDWTASGSAWKVALVGLDAYVEALTLLTRGSILGLYASADGYEEIIAIGVLRQISSRELPMWEIECWDLVSALMTRITTNYRRTSLAYDTGEDGHTDGGATTTYTSGLGTATVTVGSTTGFSSAGLFVIGSAYYSYTGTTATTFTGVSTSPILGSAPDVSAGDTVAEVVGNVTTYVSGLGTATVTVGSTTGFSRKTGTSGAFKIGDAYYAYTGTTATTFTGVGTTPLYGSAPSPAAGDVVLGAAYWWGHPVDLVKGIFVSSGGGGPGDLYHIPWGFGFPSSYLDDADMNRWRDEVLTITSGTYLWRLLADAPIENPGSWLQDHLASAGLWMVIRQGLLTVRAAQAPISGDAGGGALALYESGEHITDEEIRGPLEVEHFDAAQARTYAKTRCTARGVDAVRTTSPGSWPCSGEMVYDVSDKVITDRAPIVAEMLTRLGPWPSRVPEVYRMTVGLDRAALVPGDLVRLTTRHIVSRYSASVGESVANAVVMVTRVDPDWMAGSCRLQLALLPDWDGVFP